MGLLDNKTALVTGASRGIGRAIALRFAAEGATVAVHYGRSETEARAVVAEIEAGGGKAFAVQANMASVAEIGTLFQTLDNELTTRTGSAQFDILVNNAATMSYVGLAETTEAQFDEMFDVNVKGVFFVTQQALPRLRDNGRIINISSLVARTVFPGVLAYAMTKGPIEVLTKHLAPIAGERGITVNSLSPGAIHTDMSGWLDSAEGAQMAKDMQSIKRVGQPADIADMAVLLASDGSRWVTGNYIEASGGAKL